MRAVQRNSTPGRLSRRRRAARQAAHGRRTPASPASSGWPRGSARRAGAARRLERVPRHLRPLERELPRARRRGLLLERRARPATSCASRIARAPARRADARAGARLRAPSASSRTAGTSRRLRVRALNEGRWGNNIWVRFHQTTAARTLLTLDLEVGSGEARVNTSRGFERGALVRIYDRENSRLRHPHRGRRSHDPLGRRRRRSCVATARRARPTSRCSSSRSSRRSRIGARCSAGCRCRRCRVATRRASSTTSRS